MSVVCLSVSTIAKIAMGGFSRNLGSWSSVDQRRVDENWEKIRVIFGIPVSRKCRVAENVQPLSTSATVLVQWPTLAGCVAKP